MKRRLRLQGGQRFRGEARVHELREVHEDIHEHLPTKVDEIVKVTLSEGRELNKRQ